MDELKYIKISKLIAGYLLNNLSDNDLEDFMRWLKEDPAHQDLLNSIRNQKNWEEREEIIKSLDKEKIWSKIQEQIGAQKRKRFLQRIPFVKYAAAVIIPLMLAYGGWYLFKKNVQQTKNNIGKTAQIVPGQYKAKLILGNGRQIELGKKDTTVSLPDKQVRIKIDSGKVEYNKKVATGKKIEMNTLVTPRGGEIVVILSDGTKVWLNAASQLKYPSVFTGKERNVYLKGEAFFKVSKDPKHPFIVHANGLVVKALGTEFDVSNYSDDNFAQATLVEGKVLVSEKMSGKFQSAILVPSQQAFIKKEGAIQKLHVHTVDTKIYTSWTQGVFLFKNETLEQIFNKLGRWYDIHVFFNDVATSRLKFSGKIPRFEDFNIIIRLMEQTNSIQFKITGKTVVISKK